MGIFNKYNNKQAEGMVIDIPVSTAETEKTAKRLFLVDYENVSDAGVVGVDTLTESDTVIIFYGSKVKSVAYESLIAITNSKASIEHLKAEKTAKNYLDFQLTTYLGYKLGKENFNEIFVISKDSGFDAVVDFWSEKGYTIKRQEAIVVAEKPEATPEDRPKRTYTRRTTSSHSRTPRNSRPKVVTKPQAKKPRTPKINNSKKQRFALLSKGQILTHLTTRRFMTLSHQVTTLQLIITNYKRLLKMRKPVRFTR